MSGQQVGNCDGDENPQAIGSSYASYGHCSSGRDVRVVFDGGRRPPAEHVRDTGLGAPIDRTRAGGLREPNVRATPTVFESGVWRHDRSSRYRVHAPPRRQPVRQGLRDVHCRGYQDDRIGRVVERPGGRLLSGFRGHRTPIRRGQEAYGEFQERRGWEDAVGSFAEKNVRQAVYKSNNDIVVAGDLQMLYNNIIDNYVLYIYA